MGNTRSSFGLSCRCTGAVESVVVVPKIPPCAIHLLIHSRAWVELFFNRRLISQLYLSSLIVRHNSYLCHCFQLPHRTRSRARSGLCQWLR